MSNSKIDNGTLINNINGQINGNGTITSTLTNNGSINVSGTLSIAKDFVNSKTGYINFSNGFLAGGTITNYSDIVASSGNGGVISSNIVNNGLLAAGGSSHLRLGGVVTNSASGIIEATANSRLTFTQALAANNGSIVIKDSSLINTGYTLTNNALMSLNGNLVTGGLVNSGTGKLYFMGDESTDVPFTSVNDQDLRRHCRRTTFGLCRRL